jgi:cytochrome c biogenesis protein CcmG/thiol:disulfide interchange protein DsbE
MSQTSRLGFLLFVGAVLLGIYLTRDGSLHQPAPAFSLPETYGGRVDLASYRGRPVLLVFWTTSCPICQHELPLLNQLAWQFRSKGIAVLTIHLGGEAEASDYMSANQISLTSLFDADGAVARAYHVSGVPKLVLIGSNGKVIRSTSGWTSESVLREWLDSAS